MCIGASTGQSRRRGALRLPAGGDARGERHAAPGGAGRRGSRWPHHGDRPGRRAVERAIPGPAPRGRQHRGPDHGHADHRAGPGGGRDRRGRAPVRDSSPVPRRRSRTTIPRRYDWPSRCARPWRPEQSIDEAERPHLPAQRRLNARQRLLCRTAGSGRSRWSTSSAARRTQELVFQCDRNLTDPVLGSHKGESGWCVLDVRSATASPMPETWVVGSVDGTADARPTAMGHRVRLHDRDRAAAGHDRAWWVTAGERRYASPADVAARRGRLALGRRNPDLLPLATLVGPRRHLRRP